MKTLGTLVIAVGGWLVVALAIDRLLLSTYCSTCANVLALELKFKLPAAEITYPPVSLLVLVALPMVALAIYLVPWRALRSSSAWRNAFSTWSQPWFWLLVMLLLTIVGESLFVAAKEYLPTALTTLAEKFSVTATLSVAVPGYKETTPLALTASLSGFIGLVVGAILFFKNGVRDLLK
ncbi:MAG: hypothetical protein Q7U97_00345 [Rhodocyclaceae bacterium]|nr:hypothetical protein [Rhodocyclaceae bacterium]